MLTTAVTLRVLPIDEVDLEPVAALVNRAFATYHEIFKGQRTSPEEYVEEAGPEARIILIEEDGMLVATGMIAPPERFAPAEQRGPAGTERPGITEPLPPGHPWTGALYFGFAGVEPARMNGGFGRMLVRHVEALAAAEGYRAVCLGTLREFGLVEYYAKLNYTICHEEEYPAGHWDVVVPHHYCDMVKQL